MFGSTKICLEAPLNLLYDQNFFLSTCTIELHALCCIGECAKDKENLLQEQGVQEAHPAQSHTIQEGEG